MQTKKLFCLIFLALCPLAHADTTQLSSSDTTTISDSSSNAAAKPTPESLIQYCPEPSKLVKDPEKLTWSAPDGWQSYQQSFAAEISQFGGVQWAGIKVGQVICTYSGKDKDTFPVQLVFDKLVIQPSGGRWGANQGGYINCQTSNVKDCPFPVKLSQDVNVFQEAEQIRPIRVQEQAF